MVQYVKKFNMFTKSVDRTVKWVNKSKFTAGEKGKGCKSPAFNSRRVCGALYPSAKAGHWETEKAGYKALKSAFKAA